MKQDGYLGTIVTVILTFQCTDQSCALDWGVAVELFVAISAPNAWIISKYALNPKRLLKLSHLKTIKHSILPNYVSYSKQPIFTNGCRNVGFKKWQERATSLFVLFRLQTCCCFENDILSAFITLSKIHETNQYSTLPHISPFLWSCSNIAIQLSRTLQELQKWT